MDLTRGSKLFLNNIDREALTGNVLDYGSKGGEIAQQLGCYFADHIISNKIQIPNNKHFYLDNIKRAPIFIDKVIFTAQSSTEQNNMLIEELYNFLPNEGILYLIISKGYSLDNLNLLPWKYKMAFEDNQYRVIFFVKSSQTNSDTSKYYKEFQVTVLDKSISISTDPSIFSSSGLDKGTRALLEKIEWRKGPLMDLGCGSGVIGIIASKIINSPITYVDVNLRALMWAKENTKNNGVLDLGEFVPNYSFREIERKNYYETILSNPPYHTDYGVAKEFIEEGYKMLRLGGTMCFVVKNPNWYKNKFKSVFGGAQVIEHLGYYIIKAEKRPQVKKEKPLKTTKKHQKKLEKSNGRKSKIGLK